MGRLWHEHKCCMLHLLSCCMLFVLCCMDGFIVNPVYVNFCIVADEIICWHIVLSRLWLCAVAVAVALQFCQRQSCALDTHCRLFANIQIWCCIFMQTAKRVTCRIWTCILFWAQHFWPQKFQISCTWFGLCKCFAVHKTCLHFFCSLSLWFYVKQCFGICCHFKFIFKCACATVCSSNGIGNISHSSSNIHKNRRRRRQLCVQTIVVRSTMHHCDNWNWVVTFRNCMPQQCIVAICLLCCWYISKSAKYLKLRRKKKNELNAKWFMLIMFSHIYKR